MADHVSREVRRRIMQSVHSRDTKPELLVRKAAHRLGLRFRLHRKGFPGTPDIVFPKYHVVIFVHGCFWHRHPGCKHATIPKSNVRFWREKFRRNRERDKENICKLRDMGWEPIIIWQCEIRDVASVMAIIKKRFEEHGKKIS